MYWRQNDKARELRVPRNYSGNVIFSPPSADIPTKQHAPRDLPPRGRERAEAKRTQEQAQEEYAPPTELDGAELIHETCEDCAEASGTLRESGEAPRADGAVGGKSTSLLPLGAVATEDLLLIALALIILQGGKEPELALLLLALLFIN